MKFTQKWTRLGAGKRRDRATKDITHIKQVNIGAKRVLSGVKDTQNRWKGYVERLQTEENARIIFGEGKPIEQERNEI